MTDTLMRHLPDLALAAALAWGAGLRLYLVVLLCGLAARFGGCPTICRCCSIRWSSAWPVS